MLTNPPRNLQELQYRCQEIANKTVGDLAKELNLDVPKHLLHSKGWIGQLLETYLGADSNNKALPDFSALNVELKTIPISTSGKPLESTYVCTVQSNEAALQWRDSWVYKKLKHVLWVPIISESNLEISDRLITQPILWHMDPETEDILRTDWEELMELLQLGYAKTLTARYGTYLHIRPKAANSKILSNYLDAHGEIEQIVPKGFYLRTKLTQDILGVSS